MRRTSLLVLFALLLPGPALGQAYRVVDLGIGDPYFPTALNNRGQILLTNSYLPPATIGAALAAGGAGTWVGAASVLWDNGATSPIGPLPGGTYSRGCGLNDAGQVGGFGDTLFTHPSTNLSLLACCWAQRMGDWLATAARPCRCRWGKAWRSERPHLRPGGEGRQRKEERG